MHPAISAAHASALLAERLREAELARASGLGGDLPAQAREGAGPRWRRRWSPR